MTRTDAKLTLLALAEADSEGIDAAVTRCPRLAPRRYSTVHVSGPLNYSNRKHLTNQAYHYYATTVI